MNWRQWTSLAVVFASIAAIFFVPPIPQNEGYGQSLEAVDRPIFALGRIVSGHRPKHIAAAVSAYGILRMLRLRTPSGAGIHPDR